MFIEANDVFFFMETFIGILIDYDKRKKEKNGLTRLVMIFSIIHVLIVKRITYY